MTVYWKHSVKGGQRQVTYRKSKAKNRRLPLMASSRSQADSLPQSEFTGTALGWIGVHLAVAFLTLFSLGIAYPWLFCAAQKWIASHTRISGKTLCFDGSGVRLIREKWPWVLLCLLTLGLFKLPLRSWNSAHTHFAGDTSKKSYYDGKIFSLAVLLVFSKLLELITFGLAAPWTQCQKEKYYSSHTVVSGHRLSFDGKGSRLFGKQWLWLLLTLLTFGIYAFWLSFYQKRWMVCHTH